MTKKGLFFVYLWLLLLVFVVFFKSLKLSLYGDDLLVISKYLGSYGPGTGYQYYDPRLFISNYGFQNITALIYLIFGFNPLPYFIISHLLRALAALGVFLFTKEMLNKKAAFISASFFAISGIGAETTDWVYNMNSYLGIFVVLLGIKYFVN